MNAVLLFLSSSVLPWASIAVADLAPEAFDVDHAMQLHISALAESADSSERCANIEALRVVARGQGSELVAQLLYFAALRDDEAVVVVGHVLRELEIPAATIVAVAADHLEHKSPGVRALAGKLLRHVEDRSPARPPDFSAYTAVIESGVRRGRPPAESLVRFMFESDPGAAVLALMRGLQLRERTELRDILWTEHVVSELLWRRRSGFAAPDEAPPTVVAELSRAATHPRWWVRMYTVEIYVRHPELRDASSVARLVEDTHEVVRQAALPLNVGR